MNLTDKRAAKRFQCQIPIQMGQEVCLTRDCSTGGVYFLTEQSFEVGDQIEFDLLMGAVDREQGVRLRCQGDVLRVEPEQGKLGLAVAFTGPCFEMMANTTELTA